MNPTPTLECIKRLEKINVKLAALGGKLCKQSELKVDFNVEKYARQTISKNQKELNDFISKNWIEKCTSNPRLYNASKFRLASFHCDENEIKIQVGITSYKELLGTHHNPKANDFLNESYDLFFKGTLGIPDEFAFMSNCLGVGAISLTTDKFIILMKRAQWTGESPNQIDRPGGHPEPDLVLGHNDMITQQKSSGQDLDFQIYNELTNDKVLEEVFQSPQNELRDEINIPMEQQSDPLLLGLIRDMEKGGRCALDFLINVNLSKDQVQKNYESGIQSEADESTELVFVSESLIKSWTISDALCSKLTQHAIGGLRLYHLYLNIV